MVSTTEQRLYNNFLAISRSMRNKPFKLRSDFDKFENTEDHITIKKIANFLQRFPQIKPEIYFKAPFELYKDQEYFDLKYFATQKAIKSYTVYMKQLEEQNPDNQIDFIADSLRYIAMFCMKENILVEDYITHKIGLTYSWVKHVKEHNVSIYSLMEYPVEILLGKMNSDETGMFLNDLNKYFYSYKMKYIDSKQAKHLVKEGIQKIKNFVKESKKPVEKTIS